MNCRLRQWGWVRWVLLGLWLGYQAAAQTFSVATYNLEQYGPTVGDGGAAKSSKAKAKIRESIQALGAEVLALQEIEGTNALLELRASLQRDGLDYPYWDLVEGADTNRNVALLSKLPIVSRTPHTRLSFLLHGRRHFCSRGVAEARLRVSPSYTFTLMVVHLKSRRQVAAADEQELREQEALVLRTLIEARLEQERFLVVAGDFNDDKSSRALRTVLGRGRTALVDLRPAERNGDDQPNPIPRFDPRNVTWTHYYGKEDVYSRLDYLLVSQPMAKWCDPAGTYVLALPNWGVGSDHRPIVARFRVGTRP